MNKLSWKYVLENVCFWFNILIDIRLRIHVFELPENKSATGYVFLFINWDSLFLSFVHNNKLFVKIKK